jgi:hypothetical protein
MKQETKNEEIENPASQFDTPDDIVKNKVLSHQVKLKALNAWEQDARQLMTASNEGMPGPEEGLAPTDHHRLGEVVRAKNNIGESPANKPSH